MKTFIRIDVYGDLAEAEKQRDAQSHIPGQTVRLDQYGAAIWNPRLGSGVDEVASNTPFETGVFVVITEGN